MAKKPYPKNRASVFRGIHLHNCVFCNARFKKVCDMCRHLQIHIQEIRYFCKHCSYSGRSQQQVDGHVARIHDSSNNSSMQCVFCLKKFNGKPQLERHLGDHTKEKPFSCDKCDMCFRFPYMLVDHHSRHSNARLHSCKFCDRTFNTISDLRSHKKLHHDEDRKRLQCPLCPATLNTKMLLKNHMRIHTGETPYSCEICQRAFRTMQSLDVHNRMHHQIRQEVHKCPVCPKQFKNVYILRGHMKYHKPKDPAKFMHGCGLCSKTFESKTLLNKHTETHLFRERKLKCGNCGKGFTNRKCLTDHEASHSGANRVNCKICNKSLTKGALKLHKFQHTKEGRDLNCVFCGKGFYCAMLLRGHIFRHLNERPHICNMCGAERRDKSSLVKHKKITHELPDSPAVEPIQYDDILNSAMVVHENTP